jgi:UDP-N-acetylglucosamine 2-epimerase
MKLDSTANFIITYPNADTHSSQIFNQLELLKKKYGSKIHLTHSLGQHLYFSCAKHCKGAFGNSSSGVIELPYLTDVINIGNRQKGRVSPSSVINCKDEISDFNNSVKKLISRKYAKNESLYGDGKSSAKIIKILKKINLEKILDKSIYS